MAEIGPAERTAALAELAAIEHTLNEMAVWLGRCGHEQAAVLLEDAWRDVLAAGALLDRDPAQVRRIVPHGQATR